LAWSVVGFGLDNASTFLVNPGDHARIAIRGGMWIGAFQHDTGAVVVEFLLQNFLFRPEKKLQTKIGNPKVRSGERDGGFVAGQIGRLVLPDQPVTVWLVCGMAYGQKPVVGAGRFIAGVPAW